MSIAQEWHELMYSRLAPGVAVGVSFHVGESIGMQLDNGELAGMSSYVEEEVGMAVSRLAFVEASPAPELGPSSCEGISVGRKTSIVINVIIRLLWVESSGSLCLRRDGRRQVVVALPKMVGRRPKRRTRLSRATWPGKTLRH